MAREMYLGIPDLASIAGGGIGSEVVDRFVSPMIPDIIPGITGKQMGNLGIGIGLTTLSLYGILKIASLAGAVAGINLITREVMNIVAGTVTPPPTVVASTNAVAANKVSGATGSNGGLVFID